MSPSHPSTLSFLAAFWGCLSILWGSLPTQEGTVWRRRPAIHGDHHHQGPSLLILWRPSCVRGKAGMRLLPNFQGEKQAHMVWRKQFARILRIRPGPLASSLQIETGNPETRGDGRMDRACVCLWLLTLVINTHTAEQELVHRII